MSYLECALHQLQLIAKCHLHSVVRRQIQVTEEKANSSLRNVIRRPKKYHLALNQQKHVLIRINYSQKMFKFWVWKFNCFVWFSLEGFFFSLYSDTSSFPNCCWIEDSSSSQSYCASINTLCSSRTCILWTCQLYQFQNLIISNNSIVN